ncbi:MAG: winged helix-turn-helix transcriptional regulator [Candidatus Diapherotrites archaeon]
MGELNHTDIKLLNYMLEKDSQNITKMAKDLNLPPSSVHARLDALRKKGIIKRMTPELDLNKLGLSLLGLIEVDVEDQSITENLHKKFGKSSNVAISMSIYGNYDYLLGVYVSTREELENIKESLRKEPGVKMVYGTLVGQIYRFSNTPYLLKEE